MEKSDFLFFILHQPKSLASNTHLEGGRDKNIHKYKPRFIILFIYSAGDRSFGVELFLQGMHIESHMPIS